MHVITLPFLNCITKVTLLVFEFQHTVSHTGSSQDGQNF